MNYFVNIRGKRLFAPRKIVTVHEHDTGQNGETRVVPQRIE